MEHFSVISLFVKCLAIKDSDPEQYAELVKNIKLLLDLLRLMGNRAEYNSIWFPQNFGKEQEGKLFQIINLISGEDNIYGRFVSMEEDPDRPETHRIVWFTDPFTATNNKFSISVLSNNGCSWGFRYLAEEQSINWNL